MSGARSTEESIAYFRARDTKRPMPVNTILDADRPSPSAVSGEPLPHAIPNVVLPGPDAVPSSSSRAHRRRTSPHALLCQASAVLECVRTATLYGDFHDIRYLLVSDACASAEDSIDRALELMGDDDADLPDDDSDLPDDDTDLSDGASDQPNDTTVAELSS
jgi:hypothetical protein